MSVDVELRYTRHQVARGARADAEVQDKIYVIKNVSRLRATYQIRLLAYKAQSTGKKLVLCVPRHCRFDESLRALIHSSKQIRRERLGD